MGKGDEVVLIARIRRGMTCVADARVAEAIVARKARYEQALHEIAACGHEAEAMRALQALIDHAEDEEYEA